ncbi:TVP38/TMEM64 family protein [Salipaludibacillus sp. CF4.18]|uniref:TVP38/TMEM64 family protein n=1 Tax=Salipaludibacillus sp. CF4.18 TaxID=3373081 RepID=UPI003EE765B3
MEAFNESIPRIIEEAGWLAPVLFILLHVIRPLLFLPVIVICIAGGYFFGFIHGTIYSIIGLTLMSGMFFKLIEIFPGFRTKITRLKQKVFRDRILTIGQVMILRMMPFVHFHLLSLYLMEMTTSYRQYIKYSVGGVILPSVLFTAFGQAITEMPWYVSLLFFGLLALIFYYLGKRGTVVYKWERFFHRKAV